jgi:hypothetical protein
LSSEFRFSVASIDVRIQGLSGNLAWPELGGHAYFRGRERICLRGFVESQCALLYPRLPLVLACAYDIHRFALALIVVRMHLFIITYHLCECACTADALLHVAIGHGARHASQTILLLFVGGGIACWQREVAARFGCMVVITLLSGADFFAAFLMSK